MNRTRRTLVYRKGGKDTMQDLFYIVIAIGFFVAAVAYVFGCDALTGDNP